MVLRSGTRVWGLGLRVEGFASRVQDSGLSADGLGVRVQGAPPDTAPQRETPPDRVAPAPTPSHPPPHPPPPHPAPHLSAASPPPLAPACWEGWRSLVDLLRRLRSVSQLSPERLPSARRARGPSPAHHMAYQLRGDGPTKCDSKPETCSPRARPFTCSPCAANVTRYTHAF